MLLPINSARAAPQSQWGPFAGMSTKELEALDVSSRDPAAGFLLPSGVRVIDLIQGTGPEPKRGARVYANYKVWPAGFRGPVADWSYQDGRPYDWILGRPDDRIPPGADEGTLGMREGGWRRLVIPNAYPTGLRRSQPVKGGGRTIPPFAGYAITPGAFAWFDLVLVDGGSGRCEDVLRPLSMPESQALKLRSISCLPDEVSESFIIGGGVGVR